MTTLDHARRYVACGFSIIPIRSDGSKAPAVGTWKEAQSDIADDDDLVAWFGATGHGIAVLGGEVSGGLEILDFDAGQTYVDWRRALEADAPNLSHRLPEVLTPGGGAHVYYRCKGHVEGNQKLAERPPTTAELLAQPKLRSVVLAETRGEGGYVLAPGTPAKCHPDNREYLPPDNWPDCVPVVTADEREFLLVLARSFNEYVREAPPTPTQNMTPDTVRPGDDYDAKATWDDLLGGEGWVKVRTDGQGRTYWRRPGKDAGEGWSATTGVRDKSKKDLLYVFTTGAGPLEHEKSYTKFQAYTALYHRGDYREAAQALRDKGYGEKVAGGPKIVGLNEAKPAAQAKTKLQQLLEGVQKEQRYTHDELLQSEFADPTWVVDGLIPDEGLTFLGGKKKLGKSWFCLQVTRAVAGGGTVLGKAVARGKVLYVCLEDGARRLKKRLERQKVPGGLDVVYFTSFPKLDGPGMDRLYDVLCEEKPRLLIVDTLAAAKTGKTEENAAGPMADLCNSLRLLSQHTRTGVLTTHHHGKAVGGDPGDDMRGSSAVAAAADMSLGLYREEGGTFRLKGEGRDIEAFSIPIKFDAHESWIWLAVESTANNAHNLALRCAADAEVVQAVRILGEATADGVAETIGKSTQKTRERLRRLADEKVLLARFDESRNGRPATLYRVREEVISEGPE